MAGLETSSIYFEKQSDKRLLNVIKTFDFDGLKIEVIAQESGVRQSLKFTRENGVFNRNLTQVKVPITPLITLQSKSNKIICAICLNPFDIENTIKLRKCQDEFCRLCITKALIHNEHNVIYCPSKYTKCDSEISAEEIKSILGDTNTFDHAKKSNESSKSVSNGSLETFINAMVNADQDAEYLGAAGLWAFNPYPLRGHCTTPVIAQRSEPAKPRAQSYPLITNSHEFVCSICEMFVIEEQGVILKNCHHNFCRTCLTEAINRSDIVNVRCPMKVERCNENISNDEMQALLTQEAYRRQLQKPVFIPRNNTVPKLLELEEQFYVENSEEFECPICMTDINPGDGLLLKNCLHEYCKTCLARHIETSEELEVPCPFVGDDNARCFGFFQDTELSSLITEEIYNARLEKSLSHAEAIIKNSVHCQHPDCIGWVENDALLAKFHCPVCGHENCIKCETCHEGKTCEEFRYENDADARKARDDGLTNAQVQQLIAQRKAMPCPQCGVIIEKTAGCNHMTCSRCRRSFQWLGL